MEAVNGKIPVTEIFGPTIQGEGIVAGYKTLFARLFACDSRCQMCDSMHSVRATDAAAAGYDIKTVTPEELANALICHPEASDTPMVTFSGGNPALWNLEEVIYRIRAYFLTAIETQGTIWQEYMKQIDYVTVSPKGPGMNDLRQGTLLASDGRIQRYVDELNTMSGKMNLSFKIVVFDEADLDYAETYATTYPGIPLFLSVGNPFFNHDMSAGSISVPLMNRYRWLCEEVLKRPNLRRARPIPQLHVLVWGNEQGR